jgi:chorismate mutase
MVERSPPAVGQTDGDNAMKTLSLAERRRKLGEEIAAARDRAHKHSDPERLGVGALLEELSRDINHLDDDDHEGVSSAERRLDEVHRRLNDARSD